MSMDCASRLKPSSLADGLQIQDRNDIANPPYLDQRRLVGAVSPVTSYALLATMMLPLRASRQPSWDYHAVASLPMMATQRLLPPSSKVIASSLQSLSVNDGGFRV